MDPATVIATIGAGLGLVDQFRDLVLRWRGKWKPPGTHVQRAGDSLQVVDTQSGQVVGEMGVGQVQLDKWEQARYEALQKRVETNYALYFQLYGRSAGLSPEESARVEVKSNEIRQDLCRDFRDWVALFERAMGTGFPDHYDLYEVCESV